MKRIQKDSRDSPSHGMMGVFIPSCCGQTGQTGPWDRSDRTGLQQPAVQTQSTAEFLSSTRSLCCDAATSTKFRSAVLEGPRNPGRIEYSTFLRCGQGSELEVMAPWVKQQGKGEVS